jgi:hypothetical protein
MTTKKTKAPRPQVLSIRLTEDDWELLDRLQAKTRLTTISEVTRQGWRALAEKEKILKAPRLFSPFTSRYGAQTKKQGRG